MQVWVKDEKGEVTHRSSVTRAIDNNNGWVELEWPDGEVEKVEGRLWKVDRINKMEEITPQRVKDTV